MAVSKVIEVNEMRKMVLLEGKTHAEVSEILKSKYIGMRGLSQMNVRRYCKANGIKKKCALTKPEQKMKVFPTISTVCT